MNRRSFLSTIPALAAYFWGARPAVQSAPKVRRLDRMNRSGCNDWFDVHEDLRALSHRLSASLSCTGWVSAWECYDFGRVIRVVIVRPQNPAWCHPSGFGWHFGWQFDPVRMLNRDMRLADMDKAYDDLMSIFLEPSFLRA